jgi:ABC-type phosphate transport system substrate-binding protein
MKTPPLLLLLLAAVPIFAAQTQAQVIVIANASVKSVAVSKSELRDVFTGASSNLKDGSSVAPVLLKQGATHNEFLTAYLGKSDTALRATWRSQVFSGQATMPRSLESETAVVEYVAQKTGAIGYVSKATPHEGVKVLAVE